MQTIKILLLLLLITLQTHANIPPQTTYNENNQPLVIEYADGTSTSSTYDAVGRVTSSTDQNGNSVSFEYDANGQQLKSVDA